ncbi:MAG: hypothetical protein WDW36_005312 [Sanguina aurantia]
MISRVHSQCRAYQDAELYLGPASETAAMAAQDTSRSLGNASTLRGPEAVGYSVLGTTTYNGDTPIEPLPSKLQLVPLNCSAKALDWHFLPITSTYTCTFDMSGQNASSLLQQYGNHTYQAYFVYKCGQGKEPYTSISPRSAAEEQRDSVLLAAKFLDLNGEVQTRWWYNLTRDEMTCGILTKNPRIQPTGAEFWQ